jgi:hypothetical protein
MAVIASKYMQKNVIGLVTDTYGYGLGIKENVPQIPIAIAGFVLAYVDKEYETGTPLTNTANGGLTKIKWYDKLFNSERVIATYVRRELQSDYYGIKVNGRCWVKIK